MFIAIACLRYLNDVGYYGGFDQKDLDQLYGDMKSNFRSWVTGFGPLAIGADLESSAVQEFSRTLYSIRPDIALNVCKTIFQSDLRSILPLVITPAFTDISYPACWLQFDSPCLNKIVTRAQKSIKSSKSDHVFFHICSARGETCILNAMMIVTVQVTVPVYVVQTRKDMAVPLQVANYMVRNLGGWTMMEVLNTGGHLPHLSDPNVVLPVLLRCLAP